MTWRVLVISFHSIDMMTDVKVLENKSDWILSPLFFFMTVPSLFDLTFIYFWQRQSSSLRHIYRYSIYLYKKKKSRKYLSMYSSNVILSISLLFLYDSEECLVRISIDILWINNKCILINHRFLPPFLCFGEVLLITNIRVYPV